MLCYVMVIVYQTNDPGGTPFYKTYKTYMYVHAVPKGMVLRKYTLKTGIDFA